MKILILREFVFRVCVADAFLVPITLGHSIYVCRNVCAALCARLLPPLLLGLLNRRRCCFSCAMRAQRLKLLSYARSAVAHMRKPAARLIAAAGIQPHVLEGGAVYRDVYQCFRVFVAAWIDSSAQVSQTCRNQEFSSLLKIQHSLLSL